MLKIYPQVKFLGITFDSKLTFQKHFKKILGHCNTRYHRVRLIVNNKWGPSPSTILQIYKQCVRPSFEHGSLSTTTTSDRIISKIQWLQNKFIRLALRLPKYISVKLLHDSSGLPYVKDRLLSCATRTLEKISKNPSVEKSIAFNRVRDIVGSKTEMLIPIPPSQFWHSNAIIALPRQVLVHPPQAEKCHCCPAANPPCSEPFRLPRFRAEFVVIKVDFYDRR